MNGVIQRLGLGEKAAGYRAMALWAEVAGADIARRTAAARFVDGVLYVDVDSPAWASQLTFVRETLIGRLNARVGGVVREIRFRPRTPRKTPRETPLSGLALVQHNLRILHRTSDDNGCALPPNGRTGAKTDEEAGSGRLAGVFRTLYATHRRLERARIMSGWEKCPACGRVYEPASGKCPCITRGR